MSYMSRLQKELLNIRNADLPYFIITEVDEANILLWKGMIIPDSQPYNKGAFLVEISFQPEYPFKPPQVVFKTKIYHPNVAEDGKICLASLNPENWKPTTKVEQVISDLAAMINSPQPDHPLRADLAEEFMKNKKKFFKVAEEYTVKHAEKRP